MQIESPKHVFLYALVFLLYLEIKLKEYVWNNVIVMSLSLFLIELVLNNVCLENLEIILQGFV